MKPYDGGRGCSQNFDALSIIDMNFSRDLSIIFAFQSISAVPDHSDGNLLRIGQHMGARICRATRQRKTSPRDADGMKRSAISTPSGNCIIKDIGVLLELTLVLRLA